MIYSVVPFEVQEMDVLLSVRYADVEDELEEVLLEDVELPEELLEELLEELPAACDKSIFTIFVPSSIRTLK